MNGAPDWQDGECCFRCRTQFTLVARRHHCRNCGNIFCAKCSSQQIPLPKLNIEKNVRVCDTCYEKIASKNDDPLTLALDSKDKEQPKTKQSSSKSSSSNKTVNTASAPSEQELKEEEELQLALALSLSQEQLKVPQSIQSQPVQSQPVQSQPIQSQPIQSQSVQQQPVQASSNQSQPTQSQPIQSQQPEYHVQDRDIEVFRYVGEVQSTLEIFSNRLESCKLRNRPVSNDSAIQSMFLKLNAEFQPKLAEFIKTYEDERANYERLQDKLSQIADARAALDALREEYKEKMRQQAAEAERLRQNQLATKLEAMRQKKSQMMQYQRDLALQRIREQEMMLSQQQQQQQQPVNNTGYQMSSQMPPQQQMHQYQHVPAPPATQVTQPYVPPPSQVTQPYAPQVSQPYVPAPPQVTQPYVPPAPPQPAIDRASIAQLERQFLPNSKPEEDTPLISFDD